MIWEVRQLPKKKGASTDLPREATVGPEDVDMDGDGNLDIHSHTRANSEEAEPSTLLFPKLEGNVQLRDHWYMQRRHRPMVPAPSRSPMPEKQECKSKKSSVILVVPAAMGSG